MKEVLKLIAGKGYGRFTRIALISVLEAVFSAVPYLVLYLILCDIIDKTFTLSGLLWYIGVIVVSTLFRMTFSILTLLVSRTDGTLMVKGLRLRLGEHIRKLSLGFFNTHDIGELSSKTLENVNKIEMIVTMLLPEMISLFVLNSLVVIGLFFIDARMAVATLISMPLALGLLNLARRIMDKQGRALYQSSFELSNGLLEFVNGIKFIKLFNRSDKKLKDLIAKMDNFKVNSLKTEGALSPVMTLSGISIDFGFVMLVVIGSLLMSQETLTGKTFLIFVIISSRFFENLKSMTINYVKIKYLVIAGDTVGDVFKEKPLAGGMGKPDFTSHKIKFKDVWFSYDTTAVLKGINLALPENGMTALVGPSGSGKTTLASLVARFFDPDSGTISIGDQRIDQADPEDLLKEISIVFQNVILFRDTVYNNIKVGNRAATEAEIIEAAKKANCHDFVSRLPNGYETMIGENGANLSGGEKQRISICRAILKNAPIVLLDEATASLDPQNEIKIQNAISNLLEDKTIIVIAHRLKTIRHADKIVVLENGKIREEGTHDQLLMNHDLYYRMRRSQQNAVGWKIDNRIQPGNMLEDAKIIA